MNAYKAPQRSRTGEADTVQVDDQVRAPATLNVLVESFPKHLHWGGIKPQAVPEFRDEKTIFLAHLNRWLQHENQHRRK